MVPDKQNWLIRDVFFSDNSCFDSGYSENNFESPLNDPQGADIPRIGVKFSDYPFYDKNRDRKNEISDEKYYDTYKSKHSLGPLFLCSKTKHRAGKQAAFSYSDTA